MFLTSQYLHMYSDPSFAAVFSVLSDARQDIHVEIGIAVAFEPEKFKMANV